MKEEIVIHNFVEVLDDTDTKLKFRLKSEATEVKEYTFVEPDVDDGAAMWELVKDSGVLDLNSSYSYLMMCEFFSKTCLAVKNSKNELVGFVTAFHPPKKKDVIFVWQIGVAKSERGKGLGSKILNALLNLPTCKDVKYLEATISPSNIASQSLFRGIARKKNTNCVVLECFPEEVFPTEGNHEPEMTYRIGPLK
ncbi:diaminobutyrate acetyltransferase [Anaerobacillus sp. MEB173]|uniref:diaminobutyrate acetyltransferase n=1 Tax=Anaerobacillus sp. MEB173 TaxID=3383345 RepID=UPI003F933EBB